MMGEETIHVYVQFGGSDHLVGRLWTHGDGRRRSASFRYAESWLTHEQRFELEPYLPLTEGTQHTDSGRELFASFSDCAPDTWGRMLIRRHEESEARREARTPRRLGEADYLLGVSDIARQGALRFKRDPQGNYLAETAEEAIPPLVTLPKLLVASQKVSDGKESDRDLRELLFPGSSLGGARPKASFVDRRGELYIAKFPKRDDENNVVLWEAVALTLAERAGLNVQRWQLENVGKKSVLLLKRFDRCNRARIPFISAMTLLNAHDGESGQYSYLDIADGIRRYGARAAADLRELWSRMLFSVLISNTDDHLRNHGFLRLAPQGWCLAPLYDVNPSAFNVTHLQLNINETDNVASVPLVLSVADAFGLTAVDAELILARQRKAVSTWQAVAKGFNLPAPQIERMKQAFTRPHAE